MLLLLQSSVNYANNAPVLFQQQTRREDERDDDDLLIFGWLLFMSRYYDQER